MRSRDEATDLEIQPSLTGSRSLRHATGRYICTATQARQRCSAEVGPVNRDSPSFDIDPNVEDQPGWRTTNRIPQYRSKDSPYKTSPTPSNSQGVHFACCFHTQLFEAPLMAGEGRVGVVVDRAEPPSSAAAARASVSATSSSSKPALQVIVLVSYFCFLWSVARIVASSHLRSYHMSHQNPTSQPLLAQLNSSTISASSLSFPLHKSFSIPHFVAFRISSLASNGLLEAPPPGILTSPCQIRCR